MTEHHFTVESQQHHQRIDVFLTQVIPDAPSRTFIKQLVIDGQVLVNGEPVKPHHKVLEGDVVDIHFSEPEDLTSDVRPEAIDLDIFYEDDFLMIVNKPAGMLVHPVPGCASGTLVNALLYHSRVLSNVQPVFRPGIVHRLDRETSGLICVAKDNRTHVRMARQFEKHRVFKCYVALVKGHVGFDEGKVDLPLGRHPRHFDKRAVSFAQESKEATTIYRVVRRFESPMTTSLGSPAPAGEEKMGAVEERSKAIEQALHGLRGCRSRRSDHELSEGYRDERQRRHDGHQCDDECRRWNL